MPYAETSSNTGDGLDWSKRKAHIRTNVEDVEPTAVRIIFKAVLLHEVQLVYRTLARDRS